MSSSSSSGSSKSATPGPNDCAPDVHCWWEWSDADGSWHLWYFNCRVVTQHVWWCGCDYPARAAAYDGEFIQVDCASRAHV